MSLHRNFFKETRSLVIVSASGFFLLSQAIPGESQERALPKLTQSLINQTEEPGRLPLHSVDPHPLFTVTEGRIHKIQHVQAAPTNNQVRRLYKTPTPAAASVVEAVDTVKPVAVQPVLQSPPTPVQQTAGTRVPRKSLFDRLVGKVRGNSKVPAGPPQDPGMNYTTVTEAKLQKTQAPQLVQQPKAAPAPQKFTPPPVPAAVDAESFEEAVSSMKSEAATIPRTFPAPNAANTDVAASNNAPPQMIQPPNLPEAFIPPMPGSDEYISLGTQGSGNALENSDEEFTPQNFPELKSMMTGQAVDSVSTTPEKLDPPTSVASRKSKTRPILDLNGPLPLLEDVLKSEEIENERLRTAAIPPVTEIPQPTMTDIPALNPAESVTSELAAPEMPSESNVATLPSPAPAPVPAVAPEVVESKSLPVEVAETASDPLANPFPVSAIETGEEEDLNAELLALDPLAVEETSEPSVASAPAMPEEDAVETEKPYTGLSLEDDLFLQAKAPAPAEPSTMLDSKPASLAPAEEEPGLAVLEETALPELPPFPSLDEPKVAESDVSSENEQLTPSKEIPQLQTPEPEVKVAMAAPDIRPQTIQKPQQTQKQSKMELILSRKDRTGLKGFCPVALRDSRDLVDVDENYSAIFNNKKYSFSNAAAMQKFLAAPEKYAPAMHGSDVIHLSLTGEELEGTLDYAVWFKGRLYLFSSIETMETFVAAPNSHETNL